MTLREITISGLYGYIDKHIEFHRDINLLVGINGSGKTSILNIISWMLNPAALPNLCLTQFSEVSLKITYKTVNYELVCKKKSKQMTFHITREGVKSKSFHPLEIPLFQLPEGFAAAAESRKAALERYSGMKPNKKELPAFTLWQEIPKAVILGLDRTVSRESKDPRLFAGASAIEQIQEIANTNYSRYQSRMGILNNNLRNEFMLSAFNISHLKTPSKPARIEVSKIQKWRERFSEYLSQSPASNTAISPELRQAATNYFDMLDVLLTAKRKGISHALISMEFQKLNRLITYLENFEKASEHAYSPIKSYLQTLNTFFIDSSKQLLFKTDTYQICFQVLDKQGKAVGNLRNVELLSSGERQLLTLFTFIKFSRGGIYIIDEPELSLHPKWQDGFLEAIKGLMPAETQLILATHSPAIVGRNRAFCKTLLPYNA